MGSCCFPACFCWDRKWLFWLAAGTPSLCIAHHVPSVSHLQLIWPQEPFRPRYIRRFQTMLEAGPALLDALEDEHPPVRGAATHWETFMAGGNLRTVQSSPNLTSENFKGNILLGCRKFSLQERSQHCWRTGWITQRVCAIRDTS